MVHLILGLVERPVLFLYTLSARHVNQNFHRNRSARQSPQSNRARGCSIQPSRANICSLCNLHKEFDPIFPPVFWQFHTNSGLFCMVFLCNMHNRAIILVILTNIWVDFCAISQRISYLNWVSNRCSLCNLHNR